MSLRRVCIINLNDLLTSPTGVRAVVGLSRIPGVSLDCVVSSCLSLLSKST